MLYLIESELEEVFNWSCRMKRHQRWNKKRRKKGQRERLKRKYGENGVLRQTWQSRLLPYARCMFARPSMNSVVVFRERVPFNSVTNGLNEMDLERVFCGTDCW